MLAKFIGHVAVDVDIVSFAQLNSHGHVVEHATELRAAASMK
jgi:hypothetical protein